MPPSSSTGSVSRRTAATTIAIAISIAALGVSIWSVLEARATSKAQAREQTRQAALSEAQTVQFVGGVTKNISGESEIDAVIENFNKYPLVYEEIQWPGGVNSQYTSIGSCEEVYLAAPTASYPEPFKYVLGAVLYYRTPAGATWARRLNGLPFRAKGPSGRSYIESAPTAIADCSPS